MPFNFDDAFERVEQLAADFKANEGFYLDALVYELYGLTPDEIKIVEGTSA
jgi:hypothetical protein